MPSSAAAWFSRASSEHRIWTSPILNFTVAEDSGTSRVGQRIPIVLYKGRWIDWMWASTSKHGRASRVGGLPMVHSTPSRILLSVALLFLALPVSAKQELKKPQEKPSAEDKKAAADQKKANEEAGKKAVSEFDSKIKDCKTIPEKALAILAFGAV